MAAKGKIVSIMASLRKWGIALLVVLFAGATAIAWGDDVEEGKVLYVHLCASCHGENGDGRGPVAQSLSTAPADLRILSKRYGNPLPENEIARFIDGREDVKAHGSRDMPVWGEKVWQGREGETRGQVSERIAQLIAYLQSIQILGLHASLK